MMLTQIAPAKAAALDAAPVDAQESSLAGAASHDATFRDVLAGEQHARPPVSDSTPAHAQAHREHAAATPAGGDGGITLAPAVLAATFSQAPIPFAHPDDTLPQARHDGGDSTPAVSHDVSAVASGAPFTPGAVGGDGPPGNPAGTAMAPNSRAAADKMPVVPLVDGTAPATALALPVSADPMSVEAVSTAEIEMSRSAQAAASEPGTAKAAISADSTPLAEQAVHANAAALDETPTSAAPDKAAGDKMAVRAASSPRPAVTAEALPTDPASALTTAAMHPAPASSAMAILAGRASDSAPAAGTTPASDAASKQATIKPGQEAPVAGTPINVPAQLITVRGESVPALPHDRDLAIAAQGIAGTAMFPPAVSERASAPEMRLSHADTGSGTQSAAHDVSARNSTTAMSVAAAMSDGPSGLSMPGGPAIAPGMPRINALIDAPALALPFVKGDMALEAHASASHDRATRARDDKAAIDAIAAPSAVHHAYGAQAATMAPTALAGAIVAPGAAVVPKSSGPARGTRDEMAVGATGRTLNGAAMAAGHTPPAIVTSHVGAQLSGAWGTMSSGTGILTLTAPGSHSDVANAPKALPAGHAVMTPIGESIFVRMGAMRATPSWSSFHMVLQPQALGMVTIHLERSVAGLQVSLLPQHAETQALLDKHLPELIAQLSAADPSGTLRVNVLPVTTQHTLADSPAVRPAHAAPDSGAYGGQGAPAQSGGGHGQRFDQGDPPPEWVPHDISSRAMPVAGIATAGLKPITKGRVASVGITRIDVQA